MSASSPNFVRPNFVRSDSYLTLHYRITVLSGAGHDADAGVVFVDTFSGRPATLQLGSDQWTQAMQAPLIGRAEGEQFSFTVAAAQAYGKRNPDLLQNVSRALLAEHGGVDTRFVEGDVVEFTAPDGTRYSGVLKTLYEDYALFDFNHPLAGADLRLDVSILGVL